ncbi:MAG: YggT family protein [Thermodesulfovibrionales bacterium]|nr:YggT family protein [Thermodesulfovibrionales bacterium]
MLIIGNFLIAIANIADFVLTVYKWIIIIAAVVSWVNPDPYNPIVRLLYRTTEPVLRPVRRLIGNRLGPIDISPLIGILVFVFIQMLVLRSIMEICYNLTGGALI